MFGLYSFHLRTKHVPKPAHKLCINTGNEVNFTNSQVFHLQFYLYKMKKKIYDLKSLFSDISVEEIISYIIEQINVQENLAPVSLKLIFRRLLIIIILGLLLQNTLFKRFLRQINGCIMVELASFIFSLIYMSKMENDAVISSLLKIFR